MASPNPTITISGGKRGKGHAVAQQLRHQIVHQLEPGGQLPTFGEMEQSFKVSRAVLRDAVDRLKHDGFIYSVDRRGLYVSQQPPHLSRFALVFPQNPSSASWPRFFTALQQEAAGLARDRGDIHFVQYHDVISDPVTPSHDLLCAEVQAHRLAGVLLMPGCHELGVTEPFASMSIPMLYICGDLPAGHTPSITVNTRQMIERMTQWVREHGRKRIAAVGMADDSATMLDRLIREGVVERPHWAMTVGRDNVVHVSRLIALLMDYPADERPDGLMVLDDNLTEYALSGLIGCGLRVGEDVDVIAHCNWPWPVPSLAPVQRVGFHARQLLAQAVRAVEQLQAGVSLETKQINIPALFEEESQSVSSQGVFHL